MIVGTLRRMPWMGAQFEQGQNLEPISAWGNHTVGEVLTKNA